jgi:hypothetical protein
MAGSLSQFMQANMLNWVFGGATANQPAAQYVGLSLGTPTSVSGSECSVAGYTRQGDVSFAAAGTPTSSGTASNAAAVLFTFAAACTIKAFQVWNTSGSSNSGTMLAWGTLSASSTFASGDIASFSAGALVVTLA